VTFRKLPASAECEFCGAALVTVIVSVSYPTPSGAGSYVDGPEAWARKTVPMCVCRACLDRYLHRGQP
jgi:hypothetical protein